MKEFREVPWDLERCREEVGQLEALLQDRPVLGERRDILPFFRKRPHLSSLCGIFGDQIVRPDRVAWEYQLYGDLGCDLVVGDWQRRAYCFIEFEDAGPRSVFEPQGKRATRVWSRRFERGFSQLIDWFRKLDGMTDHPECEARFGKRAIDYEGVIVAGRDRYLDAEEFFRLEWRQRFVVVNTKNIHCVTFDGLLGRVRAHLSRFGDGPSASELPPTPKP